MEFDELNWVDYLKEITRQNNLSTEDIGIGDDCAIIKGRDNYHLFTSDLSVEDIHFCLKESSLEEIARRALDRALSDIAACAGVPKFVGVSLGFPQYLAKEQLKQLARVVAVEAKRYGAQLIGGDLSRADKLFFDVWLIGETPHPITRSGAKKGDYVFVSGALGRLPFTGSFIPRIKQALFLRDKFRVNSMIDISDGFAVDFYRLLSASNKGALVEIRKIPLTNGPDDISRGEDYELIFTVSEDEPEIEQLREQFFEIGKIKDKNFGCWLKDLSGNKKQLKAKGYMHL